MTRQLLCFVILLIVLVNYVAVSKGHRKHEVKEKELLRIKRQHLNDPKQLTRVKRKGNIVGYNNNPAQNVHKSHRKDKKESHIVKFEQHHPLKKSHETESFHHHQAKEKHGHTHHSIKKVLKDTKSAVDNSIHQNKHPKKWLNGKEHARGHVKNMINKTVNRAADKIQKMMKHKKDVKDVKNKMAAKHKRNSHKKNRWMGNSSGIFNVRNI